MFNTVFGYALSLLVYHFLQNDLSIVVIGIMINVISITVAFLGYKLFVFESSGNWLHEYLRCYVTYGFSAVLGIALIWLFVEPQVLGVFFGEQNPFQLRFWIQDPRWPVERPLLPLSRLESRLL